MSQSRSYVHDLGHEVRSISGWYMLEREERIAFNGREYLYAVGIGVVEASCCGTGGCCYAVCPGAVLSWMHEKDEMGRFVSRVEPVREETVREALVRIIRERESVDQVQFW